VARLTVSFTEEARETLDFPIEVLCGPPESVGWYQPPPELLVFTPDMILLEDTLDAGTSLKTVYRQWWELDGTFRCIGVYPATLCICFNT